MIRNQHEFLLATKLLYLLRRLSMAHKVEWQYRASDKYRKHQECCSIYTFTGNEAWCVIIHCRGRQDLGILTLDKMYTTPLKRCSISELYLSWKY